MDGTGGKIPDYPPMGIYESDRCYLCGRNLRGRPVYKDVYCSSECYEIHQMIKEDGKFYVQELKKD